ncbi:MAG TPA: MFS transporter [Marmoricola sp.]|nr:MFS transporter [Marmoricola sp.]
MTSAQPAVAPKHAAEHRHLGWALALICLAQLMVVLDATIANIALPYIQSDLDFSEHALPWIITAYSLTFGGFLLLGGRCGDLFGRRRAFTFGLVLFAVASLVGGFAQNEAMLLGSRAVQGLGAAFASPNALALITTTFEPGPKRSRAFAVYAMMSGLGAAVGLLLGGWLTGVNPTVFGADVEGWRLTFLINVPIGLLGAVAAPLLLGESDRHSGRLDVPGAVTATTGLLSLVYGITRAGDRAYGWGDPWTITALVAGVLLLVLFWLLERRSPRPLLPGRIVADRDRMGAYLVMMLIPAAMFAMFFFLTLILQNVMGKSPMTTGLMFLPFSITMVVAAVVVSRLVQRVDPGKLSAVGATIAAVAVFGFSRLPYDDRVGHLAVEISYWSDIFPFVVLMPMGMALVFIPMTMSVVHGVSPADSGIASGVLNTMQQVGGSLGLATLSTIALNAATSKATDVCRGLASQGASCENPALQGVSFTHGASVGFLCAAGMLLAGGLVALVMNRIRHEELSSGELAVSAH